MKIHELKTLEPYYTHVRDGRKDFEVRLNDRDFKVGDFLLLKRWTNKKIGIREGDLSIVEGDWNFDGSEILCKVTYILSDERFCKYGHVVMGIKVIDIK